MWANLHRKYSRNIVEENRKKFSITGDAEINDALDQAQKDQQDIEDEEVETFIKTNAEKEQEVDIFIQTGIVDSSNKNKRKISNPSKVTKEEIMNILRELNDKQREITMHVLYCFTTGKLPIKIFISGSASVGKSTVINAISGIAELLWWYIW